MRLIGSAGEVDAQPRDRFTDWSGASWEIVGLAGTSIYSPSGFGGTPIVRCRHVGGPISKMWEPHLRDGVAEWCGDSVATCVINSRKAAARVTVSPPAEDEPSREPDLGSDG